MSKAIPSQSSGIDDEVPPPTNDEGHYSCFRACADGTICQRVVGVPWIACYGHFRQPPVESNGDARESLSTKGHGR